MACELHWSCQSVGWLRGVNGSVNGGVPFHRPPFRKTRFGKHAPASAAYTAKASLLPWSPARQFASSALNYPAEKSFGRIRTRDLRRAIRRRSRESPRSVEAPDSEVSGFGFEGRLDSETLWFESKTAAAVGTEGTGHEAEANESTMGNPEGRNKNGGGGRKGVRKSGGRKGGTGECEEEEAVALIADVLRKKFGHQIVTGKVGEGREGGDGREGTEGTLEADEVWKEVEKEMGKKVGKKVGKWQGNALKEGGGDGLLEGESGIAQPEGREESELEGWEGKWEEHWEGAEADWEGTEEEARSLTTLAQGTGQPRRTVSPSSLLSLYRFFSSHLRISSPSTVATLLAAHPALLRSDPTNDFLPRVQLLQDYGISHADIVHVTITDASWLRSSLPQIRETLEFVLAQGVRRTKLGLVIRGAPFLIRSQARSTTLDILVDKGGVPVNKLGVIIERCPNILCRSRESVEGRLDFLSAFFTAAFEESEENTEGVPAPEGGTNTQGSTSREHLNQHLKQHLNRQPLDRSHLARLLLNYPRILISSPDRISENLSLLQSLTPPGSPSVAIPTLRHAPSILSLSSENLSAKLQFFVGLVGSEAAARVVRSHPLVLTLSKENLQGKVEVLGGLLGRENAVRAVARFPLLLTSSEETMEVGFRELVREVREVLVRGEELEDRVGEEGGLGASGSLVGERAERARQLVVGLAVKSPQAIYYSWDGNMRHKVEYLKRDMGLSIMEVLVFPAFLGFNLERRIRRRHVVLQRLGYEVVPHKEVARYKVGRGGRNQSKEAEEAGWEDTWVDEQGEERQQRGKAVCLSQFLSCTDKRFEEKFEVLL